MYYSQKDKKMKDLGKGIGIGLCGIGVGIAAWGTGEPMCCGAFVAIMILGMFW